VTLGEFGLFVIIAYAAGQLMQAVGNGGNSLLRNLPRKKTRSVSHTPVAAPLAYRPSRNKFVPYVS